MGMNVGKKGSGVNEINITPLVDVVLVLLIIFLVTMPILMKQVTLEVPRKIDDQFEKPDTTKQLSILVKADLSIVFNDGDKDQTLQVVDLAGVLRKPLDEKKGDKIVFVDFEDPVQWKDAIGVMDTIRSIASDQNHNEIKAALKLREADLADK